MGGPSGSAVARLWSRRCGRRTGARTATSSLRRPDMARCSGVPRQPRGGDPPGRCAGLSTSIRREPPDRLGSRHHLDLRPHVDSQENAVPCSDLSRAASPRAGSMQKPPPSPWPTRELCAPPFDSPSNLNSFLIYFLHAGDKCPWERETSLACMDGLNSCLIIAN